MVTVIGIDPGLASTGIGIVSGEGLKIQSFSFGGISTPKDTPLAQRLDLIFSKLAHVLETVRPDLMVVEDVFSLDRYPKSGILLGKVTGVILLAGSRCNAPVIEVPAREAKQVLTGSGRADKRQLEKSVRHLLKLAMPIKPDHASDAMALALIGLFRYKHLMPAR
ncbi:MAG: crossover junction endodeoxyribonuclease RuvC [Desulfobacterales bacterium]|nr:crossover junction endodeoxyribonuclease RuvC [Desulfobacterales bacterium]MDD4071632.1 crossover junction endodeoxyribonuclease RuvC [Desulfobacterales bacterium]MDD4391632.1 crossover junction endodeoxyribonuclease RuvC [Desulfobacterales bacterium]